MKAYKAFSHMKILKTHAHYAVSWGYNMMSCSTKRGEWARKGKTGDLGKGIQRGRSESNALHVVEGKF